MSSSSLIDGVVPAPSVCKKKHHPCLLDFLKENRFEDYCIDVELILSNGRTIKANKTLLAFSSPYLRNIIKSKAPNSREIDLSSLNEDILTLVINYMYSEEIKLNAGNIQDVLYISNLFEMEWLKKFCFEYLESTITPLNCFNLHNLAETYNSEILQSKITQFINLNFDEIVTKADFSSIDYKMINYLIESVLHSPIISQKSIYKCILKWTKSDENSRKSHFYDLLCKIHLDELSSDFLRNDVTKEALVIDSHKCSNLLLEAVTRKLQYTNGHTSCFIVLGGSFSLGNIMMMYEISLNTWKMLPIIPKGRRNAMGVSLKNNIYFIGGIYNRDITTGRVDCYDLDESKWKSLEPMLEPRYCAASCTLQGMIYVLGGCNNELKYSVEVFSPNLNRWKLVAGLKFVRAGHAAVSCKGFVYCIGGHDGSKYLSTVERYNPTFNRWECVRSLQKSRRWLCAVATDNAIYAIGGKTDTESKPLRCMEKYDPETNTWVYCSSMVYRRDSFSACTLSGFIYVVGGNGEADNVETAVEMYNPQNDVWTTLCKTEKQFVNHISVAI